MITSVSYTHLRADSDNIQAVWLGDIDANVATQSDGFTSDSSFEITERTWYRAVETNSTILTSAYVEASTGNLILLSLIHI